MYVNHSMISLVDYTNTCTPHHTTALPTAHTAALSVPQPILASPGTTNETLHLTSPQHSTAHHTSSHHTRCVAPHQMRHATPDVVPSPPLISSFFPSSSLTSPYIPTLPLSFLFLDSHRASWNVYHVHFQHVSQVMLEVLVII